MTTSFWQLIQNYRIVIPIIQRDYAQGRLDSKVQKIREGLLNALAAAIRDKQPLELDFVYGYTKGAGKEDQVLYPLDGQQRLTTLFLLHWYIAACEGHRAGAESVLARFSYQTRPSSRDFCEQLVKYQPEDCSKPIGADIRNQSWFFAGWEHDPTISGMLTMLDAIQKKVADAGLKDVWPALTQDPGVIVFHLLPLAQLGLTDELYIRMNARGKELTGFEAFKVRFGEMLAPAEAAEFARKGDQEWADLFWRLKDPGVEKDPALAMDDASLRFFRYAADMLLARAGLVAAGDEYAAWRLLAADAARVRTLFDWLDWLAGLKKTAGDFFSGLFYLEASGYQQDRTRLFFLSPEVNLFAKCASRYDPGPPNNPGQQNNPAQQNNPFSIGEQIMLYAVLLQGPKPAPEFATRIRSLRNLVANSGDVIRRENLPALLGAAEELMQNGSTGAGTSFSQAQMVEEKEKAAFRKQNPGLVEVMHQLEDHPLLQGCLALFDLGSDLPDLASRFQAVFHANCDYDAISRALLTREDYSQKLSWFRQFGSKNDSVWREMFVPSQRRGDFGQIKSALAYLLRQLYQNQNLTLGQIVDDYLAAFAADTQKPKDWRYYFIRYPQMRLSASSKRLSHNGYYYWEDRDKKPYEWVVLRKTTLGGYHWDPFLRIIYVAGGSGDRLSHGDYLAPLVYAHNGIVVEIRVVNRGYQLTATDAAGERVLERLRQAGEVGSDNVGAVVQDADGLDLADRVERGLRLVAAIGREAAAVAMGAGTGTDEADAARSELVAVAGE